MQTRAATRTVSSKLPFPFAIVITIASGRPGKNLKKVDEELFVPRPLLFLKRSYR